MEFCHEIVANLIMFECPVAYYHSTNPRSGHPIDVRLDSAWHSKQLASIRARKMQDVQENIRLSSIGQSAASQRSRYGVRWPLSKVSTDKVAAHTKTRKHDCDY